MELIICHGEISLNSIKNTHKTEPIINTENIIVTRVNLVLIRNSLHLINAIINSNAKIVIS